MAEKKVLIAGATGYLGQFLVQESPVCNPPCCFSLRPCPVYILESDMFPWLETMQLKIA